MTWALWCILIAGLLPYVGTMIAKWGFEKYDNHNPREWLGKQSGFRARGRAAEANGFEAFPLFAAAILVANWTHSSLACMNALASIFIGARILYVVCYVTDRASLRSMCWLVGILSSVSLFVLAGLQQV